MIFAENPVKQFQPFYYFPENVDIKSSMQKEDILSLLGLPAPSTTKLAFKLAILMGLKSGPYK